MDQATLEKANSLTHKIKNVEYRLNDLDYLFELLDNNHNRKFIVGYGGCCVEIPKPIRKNIFKSIKQEYQRELNQLQNELKAL